MKSAAGACVEEPLSRSGPEPWVPIRMTQAAVQPSTLKLLSVGPRHQNFGGSLSDSNVQPELRTTALRSSGELSES